MVSRLGAHVSRAGRLAPRRGDARALAGRGRGGLSRLSVCAFTLTDTVSVPFSFRIGFDYLSVVSTSSVAVALRVDNVRELQNDVHTLGANGGIWAEQFAIQCVSTFLDVHICILDKTKLKKNVLFTRISPSAEKNAPGYRAKL